MTASTDRYRTIFVGELVQTTGLSTGGRDGDLYADAIMARDGLDRPILRGTGLAGALLAVLDDFDVDIPDEISRRVPEGPREEGTAESLWLVHHAHLINESTSTMVRPNVAIHPWTGAAADGLYFSTEILPRGTRWRLIIETDDWRDSNFAGQKSANRLLALALREWTRGCCWLGRSPARGLGWARLEYLRAFSLDPQAAFFWPNAMGDPIGNIQVLEEKAEDAQSGVMRHADVLELLDGRYPEPIRRHQWHFYRGCIRIGEREDGYGLDTLSTLARDFPADQEKWAHWRQDSATVNGQQVPPDGGEIDLDSAPAWTLSPEGDLHFMVPGSAIRGALRAAISAHWRRAGNSVWAPNGLEPEPVRADADPLLPLFGSINHDSDLLISDAYPAEDRPAPQLYVQELHAEDEFTQGPYGSSKFNRPCLVSGEFEFELAIREEVEEDAGGRHSDSPGIAEQVIATVNELGKAGMLPLGGGVWRGHGWVRLELKDVDATPTTASGDADSPEDEGALA